MRFARQQAEGPYASPFGELAGGPSGGGHDSRPPPVRDTCLLCHPCRQMPFSRHGLLVLRHRCRQMPVSRHRRRPAVMAGGYGTPLRWAQCNGPPRGGRCLVTLRAAAFRPECMFCSSFLDASPPAKLLGVIPARFAPDLSCPSRCVISPLPASVPLSKPFHLGQVEYIPGEVPAGRKDEAVVSKLFRNSVQEGQAGLAIVA